jgi:ABC-type multidrug transport system fused ATPase/permease subunit
VAGYLISLGSSIVAAIVNIIALDSSLAPWYFYIYPPFAFSRAIAVLIIQYKPEEYPIGQYDIAISFVYLLVETIVLFILASKIWIDIPKWLFFKVYYKIKDYQIRNQNISEMRPIKVVQQVELHFLPI